MDDTLIIKHGFNGPRLSGNGGYVGGVLARHFTQAFGGDGAVEITLRAPIPIESQNGLKNDRGTVAMARTSDPNSATAQFFINVVENKMLNHPSPDGHGYAVFGKVVQGMEVVDAIRQVKTGNAGSHQNVPTEDVVIQSATIVGAKK